MATSRAARRELLIVLAAGVAGAALVVLATRQDWARVIVTEPRPLPSSVTRLAGQDLVPAATPVAVAALAGLAAVLATRGVLRRITGVLLAVFGVVLVAALGAGITAADMLAAAAGGAGSAVDGGSGAGSTTSGSSSAGSPVTAFPGHAVLSAGPWRPVAIAGAALIIAVGAAVAWRASRLPVMSARYEAAPTAPSAGPGPASPAGGGPAPGGGAGQPPGQARPGGPDGALDSASMWELLSQGEDPTGPGGGIPGRASAESRQSEG